jgi:hypothetical protein
VRRCGVAEPPRRLRREGVRELGGAGLERDHSEYLY